MSFIARSMGSSLFKPFITFLFLVGIVFFLALQFHLFYTVMWFDMIMHSLAGFFISLWALVLLDTFQQGTLSYGQMLFCGILSAIIIGILWECYELYFGITYFWSPSYWGDNGMDVTMDTLGGLLAVLYAYSKLRKGN